MWDAIKSDLFDFVSTITEDTTKTINIVLGDTENEDVRNMLSITFHAVPHPVIFLLYLYYYLSITSYDQQPEVTLQQKLIADLRRSYETYSTVSYDTSIILPSHV